MTARSAPSRALRLAAIGAMVIVSACGTASSAGVTASPSFAASPSAALSEGGFPDGTYETEITAEEVEGRPEAPVCPCTWGFILEDGTFRLDDPSEQPFDVEFIGDQMTLPAWNMGHGGDPAITVRWVYDEQTEQVTLSDTTGGTEDDRFVFERTWERVD